MRAAALGLIVLVSSIGPRVARADEGDIEARFVIEAAIDKGRSFGRPLSMAPDVWWSTTSRLTLGLVHSNASLDRIDAGRTFCVRPGVVPGWTCEDVYRGSGLDARYAVVDGDVVLAPRLRLLVRDLSPFKPAVTLGALARARRGRIAVTMDPYLRLGLANTDRGNRAALEVPLWLSVHATAGTALWAHIAYESDVAVARDGWKAPVGVGITHRLAQALSVELEFGWPALLGPQHYLRRRNLMLAVIWNL